MASYQDIEVRLARVERMLHFVMSTMHMQGVITNGLLNPDGSPAGKQVAGSLLDFYRMQSAAGGAAVVADGEIVNG